MIANPSPLSPGLYLIATPIGNLRDITLRAIDILKNCDVIACEDTRVSRKLLSAYGISRPLLIYNDHKADEIRPEILKRLGKGQRIGLISDAGTPLISDPGYKLVRSCQENDYPVIPIPGPSSVLAALIVSGQPTDRFAFLGFVNSRKLNEYVSLPMTLIFFEAARRLIETLSLLEKTLPGRTVSVVRELTKIHEEIQTGTYENVRRYFEMSGKGKGEVVLVLSPPEATLPSEEFLDDHLRKALKNHTIKDAAALVSGALSLPKKIVYQRALHLKGDE